MPAARLVMLPASRAGFPKSCEPGLEPKPAGRRRVWIQARRIWRRGRWHPGTARRAALRAWLNRRAMPDGRTRRGALDRDVLGILAGNDDLEWTADILGIVGLGPRAALLGGLGLTAHGVRLRVCGLVLFVPGATRARANRRALEGAAQFGGDFEAAVGRDKRCSLGHARQRGGAGRTDVARHGGGDARRRDRHCRRCR